MVLCLAVPERTSNLAQSPHKFGQSMGSMFVKGSCLSLPLLLGHEWGMAPIGRITA
jgi:hypothetical protein